MEEKLKHLNFNQIECFMQKYELKLSNSQNIEFNTNQKKCHSKIYYTLVHLMQMIEISRKNKTNNFEHIPIYKTAFMDLDVPLNLEEDFSNLTKLDQYKVIEMTNDFVKDLSRFIPEYNNYTYTRKLKEIISSITSKITAAIYYKLENGCRMEYFSENSYVISLF